MRKSMHLCVCMHVCVCVCVCAFVCVCVHGFVRASALQSATPPHKCCGAMVWVPVSVPIGSSSLPSLQGHPVPAFNAHLVFFAGLAAREERASTLGPIGKDHSSPCAPELLPPLCSAPPPHPHLDVQRVVVVAAHVVEAANLQHAAAPGPKQAGGGGHADGKALRCACVCVYVRE